MADMKIALKGLTCAHCAGKIEQAVNHLEETTEAEVNLMKQELHLELKEGVEEKEILEKVKATVHRYEKDVDVFLKQEAVHTEHGCSVHGCTCCEHTHHTEGGEDRKKLILRFILGLLLFGTAFVWEKINGASPTGNILFLGAYAVFGYDVLWRAVTNIVKGQIFDENFLMSLSTLGAILMGEMPEAVFVMLFYQVGESFQAYALERSRKSIEALMDIRPDSARLVTPKGFAVVSPEEIQVGQEILVQAGERIPLDGIIKEGSASLDMSALTGEALPVLVQAGEEAYSGSINTDGSLHITVTKTFADSTVVRILQLVENAAGRKSKTEQFITRFARVYTPLVVLFAVLLSVIPPLLGMGAFSMWVSRALIFLVVSCPCALVLSVPLSYFAGIGASSKKGILVKGGNYLDTLCHVERMVFDKTGTLTKGEFAVTKMEGEDIQELLQMAAAGEALSNHPIAKAVTAKYIKETGKEPLSVAYYKEEGGFGISYDYQGARILAGNSRLMEREGIAYSAYTGIGSVVHIAKDKQYLGYLVVNDVVRETSESAIKKLRQYGIKETVMLTGDRKETAEFVGKSLGIDHIHSELLPEDKLTVLEGYLRKAGKGKTAFVGDGINDAPVLAGADVGIAMGGIGSDAAIEAADVVLMEDDMEKMVEGIRIARKTRQIVWQNIVLALGIKGIVLVLGALGLATMWMAVFADVGVAVLAILNAMRVK